MFDFNIKRCYRLSCRQYSYTFVASSEEEYQAALSIFKKKHSGVITLEII